MGLEEAKILDKYILITDTAARETVENYNKSKIFENTEKGIYEGLKNILMNNDNNLENKHSQELYDNRNIIEQICKLIEE